MPNLFHDIERPNCKDVFGDCATLASKNLDWDVIEPILKDIEMGFIAQCIGTELYEYICELTEETKEELTDFEKKLLHATRLFVTRWIEFKAHSKLALIITNKGPQEFSDDRKTSAASKHMYNESKYEACNCAYDKLEMLIYNCIIPNKDKFPADLIENSKLWEKACQSLMFSPANFVLFKPLHNEGRLKAYWSLLPYLTEIQDCELSQCIGCPDFFDLLIKLSCEKDVAPYEKLFKDIRRYLANEAFLRAATEGILMYTGEGFKFVNSITASKTFNAGTERMQKKQCAALEKKSFEYLCKIKACLEENKDKEGFEEYLKCCIALDEPEECEDEPENDCDCPCACPCEEEPENTTGIVCGPSSVGFL